MQLHGPEPGTEADRVDFHGDEYEALPSGPEPQYHKSKSALRALP